MKIFPVLRKRIDALSMNAVLHDGFLIDIDRFLALLKPIAFASTFLLQKAAGDIRDSTATLLRVMKNVVNVDAVAPNRIGRIPKMVLAVEHCVHNLSSLSTRDICSQVEEAVFFLTLRLIGSPKPHICRLGLDFFATFCRSLNTLYIPASRSAFAASAFASASSSSSSSSSSDSAITSIKNMDEVAETTLPVQQPGDLKCRGVLQKPLTISSDAMRKIAADSPVIQNLMEGLAAFKQQSKREREREREKEKEKERRKGMMNERGFRNPSGSASMQTKVSPAAALAVLVSQCGLKGDAEAKLAEESLHILCQFLPCPSECISALVCLAYDEDTINCAKALVQSQMKENKLHDIFDVEEGMALQGFLTNEPLRQAVEEQRWQLAGQREEMKEMQEMQEMEGRRGRRGVRWWGEESSMEEEK
ncbi:uncharacterized protein MONOS_4889p2 [Monocercomonoides exilis]|uniref:uncharacterized protein n=1 Tax=Monocercomonoides exilis TaxID=2049356 RepID=UPI003559B858|nr:hypothetical protein MONOS_4889p2 [Monocercomonoides exilis]